MYNLDFDLEIATEYVTKFRAIYPEIVAKWQELENNARRAVMGRTIVGAFDGTNSECLVYKLPSGRTVGFYRPRVVNFRITYMNKFGLDESLYGGKIYNFANQGTGRDILAYAMHKFTDVAVAFGLYEAYVVHQDDWVLAVSYMPFIGILLYVVYLIRKYRK